MSIELGDVLKEVVGNQIDSMSICDFGEATIIDPNGPIIQIEGNQGPLPAASVMVPDYLKTFDVEVSGDFHGESHSGTLTIDNSLKAGDTVYYVRQTGAQKYLLIGRIK